MKVKLYHYPATRSARVLWLLHELSPEVEFETSLLDLYKGEQHDPDFMEMFPLHAVPAVIIHTDEGEPIRMTESGAIIVALADAVPSKRLAPATAPFSPERANYLQTIHSCGAALDMMLWQIRIHEHVLDRGQRDEGTIARYRKKFSNEVVPMLSARLNRSPYICGNDFSAADCMIAHAVMWARTYNLCADDACNAYLARVAERPAFQRAFADRYLFQPEVPCDAKARTLFTG